MQGMRVRPLRWEDPLEQAMTATPVFLPGNVRGRRSREAGSSRGPERREAGAQRVSEALGVSLASGPRAPQLCDGRKVRFAPVSVLGRCEHSVQPKHEHFIGLSSSY